MDNSATSYPKPFEVRRAVVRAYDKFYANSGRSSSKDAIKAASEVYRAREAIGALVNTAPENIVFTYNATYALNMAIFGAIHEGMTVAVDRFSHNSALRPLYALSKKGVRLRFLESSLLYGSVMITSLEKLIKEEKIHALVLNHISNVTGKAAPLKKLSSICRENGITLILDATQAIGNTKLDMDALGVDILASSGHKGLFGIMGTGFLAVNRGYHLPLEPIITGGSGMFTDSHEMPPLLPERLEAGTLGMMGISSMRAGAEYILRVGSEEIGRYERELRRYLVEGLKNIKGVKVYNADVNSKSIVLFNIENMASGVLADELDKRGISGRAGYHCAPLAHKLLGTNNPENDGAMRLSVSLFNTEKQCDKVLSSVNKIANR